MERSLGTFNINVAWTRDQLKQYHTSDFFCFILSKVIQINKCMNRLTNIHTKIIQECNNKYVILTI